MSAKIHKGKRSEEMQLCMKQFWYRNKMNYVLAILAQILISAVNVSLAFVILYFVEAVEYTDKSRVNLAMIFVGVFLGGNLICGWLNRYAKNRYIMQALSQFKDYIFRKIINKSIVDFETTNGSKFLNAFSNDLALIETNYLNGNIQIINLGFSVLIAMLAMLYINPILALCALGAALIPLIFAIVFGTRLAKNEKAASDENESFVDQMKDLLNGFIVIKSFKAEDEVLKLFSKRNFTLEQTKRKRRETNDTLSIASQLSNILMISLIFLIGAFFAYKGIMSIGKVIAFVQLSNYISDPVKLLIPLLGNRKASLTLIDKVTLAVEESAAKKGTTKMTSFMNAIEIDNVSYSYDGEKEVLHNISCRFDYNKSYAIVGNSGSGKSTILRLIMGFDHSYEGSISVDGISLTEIDLDSYYDFISVIQQNVFLFNNSIKENITLFRDFEESILDQAINIAGLKGLIEEKGLNYECGEFGCELSGGEKQRVSIARCIVRQTPIMLVDEATAALDNITAYEVTNSILSIEGLTKIIVTHKLEKNLLQKFDKIIVMKDGTILETGNFDSLMENKSYFYSLYNVGISE